MTTDQLSQVMKDAEHLHSAGLDAIAKYAREVIREFDSLREKLSSARVSKVLEVKLFYSSISPTSDYPSANRGSLAHFAYCTGEVHFAVTHHQVPSLQTKPECWVEGPCDGGMCESVPLFKPLDEEILRLLFLEFGMEIHDPEAEQGA